MFVSRIGPVREHAHVDHRRARAQLDAAPEDEARGRDDERARAARRGPAPVLALGERDHQRQQRRRRAAARPARRPATASGSATRARTGATSTSESATGIEPSRKSRRHEKLSTITPERTIPKPPPMPQTAESRPIPTLTFSAGNSSRMIAKLSGKSAPPAPETTRKAISDQMFHANAAAEAAGEEEPEADEQHPLLAELVAEPAEDRRRDRAPRRGSRSGPRSSTPCSSRTPPGTSGAPGRPSSAAARTRRRRASGSRA